MQPPSDMDPDDRPWRPASAGRAFVYVFPCHGENILKLGFSRDPLDRLQSLHQRYFDFFDLDAALLIETDTVREARAIELAQGRALKLHSAPAPLLVSRAAGGHTEWYRGALQALVAAADAMQAQGYRVHRCVRGWLRERMAERAGVIHHWSARMLEAIELENATCAIPRPPTRLESTLRNALDACEAAGLPIATVVPVKVCRWHADLVKPR